MATNYPDFQSAHRDQMHESAIVPAKAPPAPASNYQGVIISIALAIGAVVVMRVMIRKIADLKTNRKADAPDPKQEAGLAGAAPASDKAQAASPEAAAAEDKA